MSGMDMPYHNGLCFRRLEVGDQKPRHRCCMIIFTDVPVDVKERQQSLFGLVRPATEAENHTTFRHCAAISGNLGVRPPSESLLQDTPCF